MRSVVDQLLEIVDVALVHDFWEAEASRDGPWNAQLVDRNRGIARNN